MGTSICASMKAMEGKTHNQRVVTVKCWAGSVNSQSLSPASREVYAKRLKASLRRWPHLARHVHPLAGDIDAAEHPEFDLILCGKENNKGALDTNEPFHLHISRKYISLYSSAKRRGKEFDLSLKDIALLLVATRCFYTGVRLTREEGNYQRTVDRVDNTKGYVKGNVVACCHLANQIKNELFERPTSDLNTNVQFMLKMTQKLQQIREQKNDE